MRILLFLLLVSFLPCKSQSLFHSLLTEQGNQFDTPALISDNITATTALLLWQDVDADNYILQQDGVQIYSGANFKHTATSLTAGTYSFRVKAQKTGFADSPWTTISVVVPVFYNSALYASTSAQLVTAARQANLEPSVAGVDRARSYSCWFVVGRGTNPSKVNYLFNTYNSGTAAFQMAIYRVNGANQTAANCERLRFGLFNGANLLEVQTTTIIKPGRPYHLVVTYSGSETSAGMKIYLDGVLETLTTFTGGTYTGALNSADLRFYIGNASPSPTREFTGDIKDAAVWSTELDQTEVTEAYNSGVPLAPSSLSYYGDIVAYYPLSADSDCINNATYNLTNSSSAVTFSSRSFTVEDKIGLLRTTSGNTRYVAFSGAYKDGTKINTYVRSGTSHLAGGRIDKIQYDIPTRAASAPATVITDGTYSMSGVSAGQIDGDVSVFSTRYDPAPTDAFIDSRRYVSTDGLTGLTFDAGTVFASTGTRFEFYGKVVEANGIIVVPYFGHSGTGTYVVSVFVSSDNGANWTKTLVYNSGMDLGESNIVYGEGTWVMLARRDNSPYGIYQMYSTDNCATWSSPVLTNLAGITGRANVDIELNSIGEMMVAVMDRSATTLNISKNNKISTVVASPTSYSASTSIFKAYTSDSYPILGYPNLIRISDETYFLDVSSEFSTSRADMYYSFGNFNRP